MTGFSVDELDRLESLLHAELQPVGQGRQGRPAVALPNTHDRLVLFFDYFKKIAMLFGLSKTKTHNKIVHEVLPRPSAALTVLFVRPVTRSDQVKKKLAPTQLQPCPAHH